MEWIPIEKKSISSFNVFCIMLQDLKYVKWLSSIFEKKNVLIFSKKQLKWSNIEVFLIFQKKITIRFWERNMKSETSISL